ncbi:hypothetical protein [Actinocatenispora rupis]|uniref:Uncharacterized protein n=1 Tax=Actinocatenispora rupis TaxID=519421 RepID=A0A8J3IW50_9ACTN|nr:hypothetical protein [Actinocatenispora rupis]GID09705.1 hypothetical protein Aru02nite_05940 [Actinocatenispora rupis]
MTLPRADGAGAARRARWSAAVPVALLYLLAGAFGLAVAWRLPWVGDTGLHLAVIEQLSRNLGNPPDPLVGAHSPSPYYTPYSLVQALLMRGTGLGARDVLRLFAVVNALLVASGVHHLIRRYCREAWAPLLAVLAIVLLDGTSVLVWSGYYGLVSLTVTLFYPSTFALGVTLHLWALLAWLLPSGGPPRTGRWQWLLYPAIGLIGADVALDHQFTAIGAALGCLALLVHRARHLTLRHLAGLAVAVAVTVAVVAAWPYFSILSLTGSPDQLDTIHRRLYSHVLELYGLGLLTGLPVLAVRFRRSRTDPFVLLAAFTAVLVGYGLVTSHYAWGRAWPMLLLAGQLALGMEFAAVLSRRGARNLGRAARPVRAYAAAALAVALLMGLWTQAGGLAFFVRLPAVVRHHVEVKGDWGTYSWITRYVPPGETVLADTFHSLRMVPAYRIFTVTPAYPEPWLPSEHRRDADTAAMLAADTPAAERDRLFARYGIRWLILYPSDARRLRAAGVRLDTVAHSPKYPRDGLYRLR